MVLNLKEQLVCIIERISAIRFHSNHKDQMEKDRGRKKLTRLDKGQNPALQTQAIKLMMPGVCAALSS